MKILLIEPFFTGSHQQWAEGFIRHSQHEIRLLTLPGRYWKWRMYGGAVELAEQYLEMDFQPDLLLVTDMLDLPTFLALIKVRTSHIPTALYFHENQITYPWSPTDQDVALQRNNQYGFLNYTSALVADHIFFNSAYHQASFLTALPQFLGQFPDYKGLHNIKLIEAKSTVLPLGMDLKKLDPFKKTFSNKIPVLLWNHRWEYDKNPELFFQTLFRLSEEGHDFQLIVLGSQYKKAPPIFATAKVKLKKHLLHFGYANNLEQYAQLLWQADFLPVTNRQDFFGGSVVEAIYCDCLPLLPKRLAFPEHIPKDLHDFYFYKAEADFYDKLREVIVHFPNPHRSPLASYVKRYDWSVVGRVYDQLMSSV